MQVRKKKTSRQTSSSKLRCCGCGRQESPRDGVVSCSPNARLEMRSSGVCECPGRLLGEDSPFTERGFESANISNHGQMGPYHSKLPLAR